MSKLISTPTLAQNTPLHAAARSGTTETVIAVIGAGADVTARAEDGATAFDLAKKYNREQLQGTDAWRCLKEAHIRIRGT